MYREKSEDSEEGNKVTEVSLALGRNRRLLQLLRNRPSQSVRMKSTDGFSAESDLVVETEAESLCFLGEPLNQISKGQYVCNII